MSNPVIWLWRVIFHNLAWKIAALAIATLIWMVVSSEPEFATFASVPLEYKNLPGDLEVSSSLLESVYLELRGPSSELRGVNDLRRPAVVLDMAGVGPGERTFTIGDGNVRLPRGVHLIRSVPSQVRFDFERRAFRSIPVRVRFTDPPPGYTIDRVETSPAEVRVIGPDSRVRKLTSAATDPVDLTGIFGRSEVRVNAFIEDAYVRFVTSPTVIVTVTMKKR